MSHAEDRELTASRAGGLYVNVSVGQNPSRLQSPWDLSLAHRMEPEGQAVSQPEREWRVGEKGEQFHVWGLVWEDEVFFFLGGRCAMCLSLVTSLLTSSTTQVPSFEDVDLFPVCGLMGV